MAQEYIGSLISLTSKSQIRYQGILNAIDPEAATISLEKVRSFGTEGRKSNPAEEIPANLDAPPYDFIVFKAADVIDLKIDTPREQLAQQQPLSDPAIQQQFAHGGAPPPPQGQPGGPYGYGGPPPPGPGGYGGPGYYGPGPGGFGGPPPPFGGPGGPPGGPGYYGPGPGGFPPGPPPQQSPNTQAAPPPAAPQQQQENKSAAPTPKPEEQKKDASAKSNGANKKDGQVDALAATLDKASIASPSESAPAPATERKPRGPRQQGGGGGSVFDGPRQQAPSSQPRQLQPYGAPPLPAQQAPAAPRAPLPAADFDMAASNASFSKNAADAEDVTPAAPAGGYYSKGSSFFDSISSDVKSKAAGEEPVRFDRGAERNRNLDTFGEAGGFGGNGRGGYRGRGRGRGRGGYGGAGGQGQGGQRYNNSGPRQPLA